MAEYNILNGAKVEYCATENGSYTQIIGLKTLPDFGSAPNKVDTTTLDNTKYETNINGLMPALDLTYEFNLEAPSANANIKKACDLEDAGTSYFWKVTLKSGILFQYKSKVRVGIKGGSSEDLETFEMYHSPEGEITRTVPTTSA